MSDEYLEDQEERIRIRRPKKQKNFKKTNKRESLIFRRKKAELAEIELDDENWYDEEDDDIYDGNLDVTEEERQAEEEEAKVERSESESIKSS